MLHYFYLWVTYTRLETSFSGLYFTKRVNYLLFHSLAELFSIVIAITLFLIMWNSKKYMANKVVIIATTIVVAEDDVTIRQFLDILLTREGFSVKVVGQGTEVIEECRKCKPDLLLLDIMMPGMDGFEVCRKIR